MVPLTSLGNASYTTGPGSIKRFNMFTTAVIRGAAAQGYSSGQAMEIMEQIARDHLPDNIGLEWSGLSYQEKQAGGQTGMVMALVFLFVFLFPCCTIRKLDSAYCRVAFFTCCRFGGLFRSLGLRIGE